MHTRLRMGAWMAAVGLVLAGTGVRALGNGDYNGDGTIDLADYAALPACMAGPEGALLADCDVFDFDSDTDVDLYDFACFQVVFGTSLPVVIDTVVVANPGNAADTRYETPGCGGVEYTYRIGKYEVTAGQYTEFLNAVATTDTYGLYNPLMVDLTTGCKIQRSGTAGSYTYSVAAEWADRPVNYVSWGDAARFANWLHNGQPAGMQDLTTTEDGSYFLNGATSNAALLAVARKWADATWVIPSEDEWYKAAYHKNDGVTGNYWDYPTGSDSLPGYVNDSGNLSRTGTPFTEGGIDPGNYETYDGDSSNPWGIGSPYFRTVAGEWENSASPFGTFDQGGNVWEWNEAVIDSLDHCLRGGSFRYAVGLHAPGRLGWVAPTGQDDEFGFRVAKVR